MRSGWTHYGPANGQPDAREVVANYVAQSRGIEVHRDEVTIVPGGKPTMFYAMLALIEKGDEVIYPNPGFPIYESMINFSGGTAVACPIRESNAFALDPEDVISRLTPRTKMVILNSPANPTGGVTPKESLEKVMKALKDYPDVWILSDEIYSRMLYDGEEHFSPLVDPELRDRIILLDGWSKTYAMTGWRMGFGVMRPDLAEVFTKLMVNSNSCTAAFSQRAGMEALTGDQSAVDAMLLQFDARRKHITKLINDIPGLSCHLPTGAFYVFPNIKQTGLTSSQLQDKLLYEGGVSCLAGTSFGAEGEGYIRFSYANSIENIEEGMRRVRKVIENI